MTEYNVDLDTLFSFNIDYSFKPLKLVLEKIMLEQETFKKYLGVSKVIPFSPSKVENNNVSTGDNPEENIKPTDFGKRFSIQENELNFTKSQVNQLSSISQSQNEQIQEINEKINACILIK